MSTVANSCPEETTLETIFVRRNICVMRASARTQGVGGRVRDESGQARMIPLKMF